MKQAAPRAAQEETELGLMEAVVTKMSRIIAHVGSGSEQRAQILSSIQARAGHPPRPTAVVESLPKALGLHQAYGRPDTDAQQRESRSVCRLACHIVTSWPPETSTTV